MSEYESLTKRKGYCQDTEYFLYFDWQISTGKFIFLSMALKITKHSEIKCAYISVFKLTYKHVNK